MKPNTESRGAGTALVERRAAGESTLEERIQSAVAAGHPFASAGGAFRDDETWPDVMEFIAQYRRELDALAAAEDESGTQAESSEP